MDRESGLRRTTTITGALIAASLAGTLGVGIFGGARLAVRTGIGALPDNVRWADVLPLAMLGAIGYTVSLLIAGLAFDDTAAQERSAAAVLAASAVASVAALLLLRRRRLSR